ncbi:uncharacterized protein LOC107470895 [Arachis duranensis]|uniref:Uncharacterized protein LOC107470895 n=1 Tax=Arachis duranensis TaxID=130453 RepID=A0A6P4C6W4_ARADU|nr:uncharacterized protein LOC107470895 [Arachis duranensis]
MPTVRPYLPPVGSPTFAADLERTVVVSSVQLENEGIFEQPDVVGTGGCQLPYMEGFGEPDRVENAMCDDDSDQELVDIIGDSDDDTGANPHAQHGPSSSASQQYPPHFSTLNLEVLGQQENGGNTVGGSSTEFQIGQSFQNKDETVLSVKDYSIRRGVEYRVIESDHLKADAAVTVKVLQQATEADYGFRLSYRKVWMAKQKVVAQIYGDWEESYAELPCWMLGVQSTMAGTITMLKTSPVRLRGEVDESTVYFHRLFWTFPPCIEAFRHCKSLVSIDAIAQDGNSNILPIAFALVEGENVESWSFFLSNLREHVTPQEAILVISDRHNGIKATLEAPETGWLPPRAF